MLQRQVGAFTNPPARDWNLVPTTCLMAVAYWMLLDLSVKPTQNHFLTRLANLNALLRDVALAGTRVVQPSLSDGHAHLPEGAVLVFMTTDLSRPGHACVIKTGLTVGGYNQENWFTTPGANHQYSEHDLATDLMWVDRMSPLTRRRVERSVGEVQYYLYSTPQEAALDVMRRYLG
jgi:hypothetical protein